MKERENVFMAIGGIWRMFTEKLGNVRVDLSQPFSLRVSARMCLALVITRLKQLATALAYVPFEIGVYIKS